MRFTSLYSQFSHKMTSGKTKILAWNYAIFGFLMLVVGCGPNPDTPTDTTSASRGSNMVNKFPPATIAIHAHPSKGPHQGSLVELGSGEFHAEIVHDKASVTIYMLDATATSAEPIDAQELTINLLHDGKPEQFQLPASPVEGDPSGKSSRFFLGDAELVAHLGDDSAKPKLMVTIGGSRYRGEIVHDHSHGAHDHAGHDHPH